MKEQNHRRAINKRTLPKGVHLSVEEAARELCERAAQKAAKTSKKTAVAKEFIGLVL